MNDNKNMRIIKRLNQVNLNVRAMWGLSNMYHDNKEISNTHLEQFAYFRNKALAALDEVTKLIKEDKV